MEKSLTAFFSTPTQTSTALRGLSAVRGTGAKCSGVRNLNNVYGRSILEFVIRITCFITVDREGDSHTKATHFNNLHSMVHFCENVMECRRIQLLAYFGELNFNRNFCKDHPDVSCDNCAKPNVRIVFFLFASKNKSPCQVQPFEKSTFFMQQYQMKNVTEDVKKIVRFVQENCEKVGSRFGKTAQQNRLTLNMLVDIFIGTSHFSKCKKKKDTYLVTIKVSIHGFRV